MGVGGATFHVVHPGVADLPAVGGQMIVVTGHCDCKRCTAQPSDCFDGATLRVFWWVWGSRVTPPPSHPCKGIVWKKVRYGYSQGKPGHISRASKSFACCRCHVRSISQLVLLTESFGEEMGLAWLDWVGVLCVRGVDGMET